MMPFVFAAIAMTALAGQVEVVLEVQRQFREIPGSWMGPGGPTTRAVDIAAGPR